MKKPEDLRATVESLQRRKLELEQIIQLQAEVSNLEARRLFGDTTLALTTRIVAEEVCSHYQIPVGMLASSCRKEKIAKPRQVIFYLVRKLTGESLQSIADLFQRDHGTVLYGIRSIENRKETDSAFARDLAKIEESLRPKVENQN